MLPRRLLLLHRCSVRFYSKERDHISSASEFLSRTLKKPRRSAAVPKLEETVDESSGINLDSMSKLLLSSFETPQETQESVNVAISSFKNKFRQSDGTISVKEKETLADEMAKSFKLAQLLAYLKEHDDTFQVSRPKKGKVIDDIISKVWQLSVETDQAHRLTKSFTVTRKLLYFLSTGTNPLLQKWAASGVDATLNRETDTFKVTAPPKTLRSIEAAITSLYKSISETIIDLSFTRTLRPPLDATLADVQRLSRVYIEPRPDISEFSYSMTSVAERDARRASKLILDIYNVSPRTTDLLAVSEFSENEAIASLCPSAEHESLPWNFRGAHWCRWEKVNNSDSAVDESKQETPHLLPQELPLVSLSSLDYGRTTNNTLTRLESVLDNLDQASEELNYKTSIKLIDSYPGLYNSFLGSVLFQAEPNYARSFSAEDIRHITQTTPSVFNNSSRLANKYIRENFPLSQADDSESDLDILLQDDLHKYWANIVFLPSPYVHGTDALRYPPFEVNVPVNPLKSNSKDYVYSDDIVAFLVESRVGVNVCMPSSILDMRFEKTVLAPVHALESEFYSERIKTIIKSMIGDVQKGAYRNIYGANFSIPVSMVIEGTTIQQTVTYCCYSFWFRREIEYNVNGFILNHGIADGAMSSGRRTESALILNPEYTVEDEFKRSEFVETTVQLVNNLKFASF
ncbi:hypothetical protein CANCADRAFT_95450 [Tortispora caseinolytica NRRL Y-17796]|uniref:Uncharacterized protein n=1 Tax=Tortispora caseinolytica NRRL Y-17796 TaxID=767744 RepID=A0A1E4TMH1_9ASCO|nr:hypothetical protein CANCADRAFT_95450 [Tortispora caseinolytica NRRL Y-17796]